MEIFLGEELMVQEELELQIVTTQFTNNYIQDCITVVDQAKWNNGITFIGGGDMQLFLVQLQILQMDIKNLKTLHFLTIQ